MAKYKRYDYHQMIMLPISLEDQLTPGTLEFGIHTVVETCMDLSLFDEQYKNDETGRSRELALPAPSAVEGSETRKIVPKSTPCMSD